MFYVEDAKGWKCAEIAKWKKGETAVGYFSMPEAEKYQEKLKIPLEEAKEKLAEPVRFGSGMHMKEREAWGLLFLFDNEHQFAWKRLAVFVRQDLLALVEMGGERRGQEQLAAVLDGQRENLTLERVVYEYLDGFLQQGSARLQKLEGQMLLMEQSLVEGELERGLNREIFRQKCQLSMLKNYFGQFAAMGALLRENEERIFWQEDFAYFKVFTDRAERLGSNTQMLCEDLIHVREALDAALNYDLNSIMKVFTVVTTIFLPLSLITGWYGMNFANMPELSWRYGYPAAALLALLVVAGCLIFFKRKKLL